MKKAITTTIILLLSAMMLFAQATAEQSTEKTGLIVFAAASMTETMTTLKGMYESANPNVVITCNFDSSGTLKTQIEQGADCDLFISAATKQMKALSEKGLIDEASAVDLLENRTALAVPQGNPKNITGFDQLAQLLKEGQVFLAIGNSDVPVGQYTQKIFVYYGIEEASVTSCLTYGSNVKEVTTQVSAASVDCGIIYATDAFSAGLVVVDTATSEMTGGKVIYPAAVLQMSANKAEAQRFLDYLKGAEATRVFESVGFSSAL